MSKGRRNIYASKHSVKMSSWNYMSSGVYITKHALLRYMQRYQCFNENKAKEEMTSLLAKSSLISIDKDGFEKRLFSPKNIFFICKNNISHTSNDKRPVKTIVTVLMGRNAQLKYFASSVDDIDYEAMSNSKAIKRGYQGGIQNERF